MNVAIIGAGFTGLTAAYHLIKKGHQVTVFEKEKLPGGLAIGYTKPEWSWTLESFYHHWFTNDDAVLELARSLSYPVITRRPTTSVLIQGKLYPMDSPASLLRFPLLSYVEKIRMAATLAAIRYNPFWKPLERYTTAQVLPKFMGDRSYEMIWRPQLQNKFGTFANDISLAWFWARLTKRTPSLAYPEGGFLRFAQTLTRNIQTQGGKVHFGVDIDTLTDTTRVTVSYTTSKKYTATFDRAIVTVPTFVLSKIAPQLPRTYASQMQHMQGLGAQTLVLRLSKAFLPDRLYWVSVCEKHAPVLAIVEHTHFMDSRHYGGEHIVYLGNYLPKDHPYMTMSPEQLLKMMDPFLQRISPGYKKHLIGMDVYSVPFAQPIVTPDYHRLIPSMQTPLKHVLLANMQQVYPWDRGTNYAVALGIKAADMI